MNTIDRNSYKGDNVKIFIDDRAPFWYAGELENSMKDRDGIKILNEIVRKTYMSVNYHRLITNGPNFRTQKLLGFNQQPESSLGTRIKREMIYAFNTAESE